MNKLTSSQNKTIHIAKHYKSPKYYGLNDTLKMGILCYDQDDLINMIYTFNGNNFVFGTEYSDFIGYNIKDVYVSEKLLYEVSTSDEIYETYKTNILKLIDRMKSRFREYNFIFEDINSYTEV